VHVVLGLVGGRVGCACQATWCSHPVCPRSARTPAPAGGTPPAWRPARSILPQRSLSAWPCLGGRRARRGRRDARACRAFDLICLGIGLFGDEGSEIWGGRRKAAAARARAHHLLRVHPPLYCARTVEELVATDIAEALPHRVAAQGGDVDGQRGVDLRVGAALGHGRGESSHVGGWARLVAWLVALPVQEVDRHSRLGQPELRTSRSAARPRRAWPAAAPRRPRRARPGARGPRVVVHRRRDAEVGRQGIRRQRRRQRRRLQQARSSVPRRKPRVRLNLPADGRRPRQKADGRDDGRPHRLYRERAGPRRRRGRGSRAKSTAPGTWERSSAASRGRRMSARPRPSGIIRGADDARWGAARRRPARAPGGQRSRCRQTQSSSSLRDHPPPAQPAPGPRRCASRRCHACSASPLPAAASAASAG